MSAAEEKKSHDCIALDIRKISVVADYFVICTGDSQRQVKAIAEGMIESLKVKGVRCWHSEGWSESSWIVLDFGDVIAHVFLNQVRDYYQLERLWGDAATVTSDK
ncbi:MAG: ribosome silencing factor [Candidatus Aureabacteria bacterium]|nr:ribosome silencing factor [Candidatus Auribacterota bacterium]